MRLRHAPNGLCDAGIQVVTSHRLATLGRRAVLAGLAASMLPTDPLRPGIAWAATPDGPNLAALDWGLSATLTALGAAPRAVPAPDWCNRYVVDPRLPDGVTDVGLLFAPNFELLHALRPGLIVLTPALQPAVPMLERIAPVFSITLFKPGPQTFEASEQATLALATKIGMQAEGERLAAATRAELDAARARLPTDRDRPLLIASPVDERHVSIYGPNSLFGAVLAQLGLTSAETGIGGETVIAGSERLGTYQDVTVILIEPPALPGVASRLATSRLWRTFSFVRQSRLHVVAPVLGSGGLPSAARFARLISSALAGDRDSTL